MTLLLRNGESANRADIPCLSIPEFRSAVLRAVEGGGRIASLFAHEGRLLAVLAIDARSTLEILSCEAGQSYPSLTANCPQAHLFEREIAEQSGVKPEGHPWLKPVRTTQAEFFEVRGEEVHEVAVGPVHAGIIEPGHFRFQCHGERVIHLEIALGYQHRGVERALVGGPNKRTLPYMETLAGDTTIGHALAYCELVEGLCGAAVPARAMAIRGIALELERLANHTGDLGALANDVGYLPTASYCGRIRGDWLNLTALLCGSRFGRGLIRPGGSSFDLEEPRAQELLARLERAYRDVEGATSLLWETPSVMARFEDTGVVSRETAEELGLVGPAARACGIARDSRQDFPSGIFQFAQIPVCSWHTGDVFARAYVRQLEIQQSVKFIREQVESLPGGTLLAPTGPLAPERIGVALSEGWRGEICHVALTDREGRFARYKVVDPSFHNWTGLAMALREQEISDFPLCNKSFNLSYCGHDL